MPDNDNNDADIVVLRTFLNRIDAELAQGALAAAEIDAIVLADDAGGTRPGLWLSGVRLLVRSGDVERANAALEPSLPA